MCRILRTILVVMIWLWMVWPAAGAGDYPLRRAANSINEAMPERVANLFKWPDASVLAGPNRVRGDESRHIRYAKRNSLEWIRKVLSRGCLPTEGYLEGNLIMIHDEFELFDVTRVEWEKNGYRVQVSQTAGVMAIKVTPLEAAKVEGVEQKKAMAGRLCAQFISDTGIRYGKVEKNRRTEVPVEGLTEKILEYSFHPELVREFPDGIIGVATTPDREGIPGTTAERKAEAERTGKKPEWDNSSASWGYWWRHVCWWHDGTSVGFFMLKADGGCWNANYWDTFGTTWFEKPEEVEEPAEP